MNKHLSTYSAVFLVVASMLGTGILTTTGIILTLVKTPGAALGVWIVGGLLALIGAWCYGELARRVPRNGGEATILRELLSPTLGEIAGLTSFVVGFAACNAASSLAFVDYLGEAMPGLNMHQQVLASLMLLVVTSLHGFFGPVGLRIQTLLATAKFVSLAGLAMYGLYLVIPMVLNAAPTSPPAPGNSPEFGMAGFGGAWGQAMMLVMFAYSGWNAAVYVAGEISEPVKNVRRILMIGTSIVVLLFISVNVVLLTQLPVSALEGVRPVIATLVKHIFGSEVSAIFSGFVAFALLSSIGVSAFLGPRVLAAMLNWLGKSAEHKNVAAVTVKPMLIWLQAGLSILMVMTGSFVQILTVMGFLLGLFPIISILCLYRGEDDHKSTSFTLVRYVFAPLFVTVSAVILLLGAWQSPQEVTFALAMVVGFYLFRIAMHRFQKT
jgi:APA family basic amino acid/polyamine antiporter